MPAQFDWTGAGATAFVSDAANWAQNVAPTWTTDSLNFSGVAAGAPPPGNAPGMPAGAAPAAANPTKSVVFDAAAPAAFGGIYFAQEYTGGVTFAQSESIGLLAGAGQTFTVNAGSTFSVISGALTGSTLQGPGTLEVGAPSGVMGGLSLSGNTSISVGSFAIDAGSNLMLQGNSSVSSDTVTNNGTMWLSASVTLASGNVTNNGSMWIGANLAVSGMLTNNGTLGWFSGTISPALGTVILNNGLFNIQGGKLTMNAGGLIQDNGLIVAGANNLTLASDLTLAASGSLWVQGWATTLEGTVMDGGITQIAAGTSLNVAGPDFVTWGTAKIDGAGTLNVNSQLTAFANTILDVQPAVVMDANAKIQ
jgi:hypothetical protein